MKKILVLTLSSGENELAASAAALKRQSHTAWEHITFSNMPNVQAHQKLYRSIMEQAGQYDLFLKLDADMVMASNDVLTTWAQCFEDDPTLDHLVTEVQDFFTQQPIEGIHMFSNRVRWEENTEGLFVDPDPTFPGVQKKRLKLLVPEVHHAPDPSPLQAFLFGTHHALKATQRHRHFAEKRAGTAWRQWRYLVRLRQHYATAKDPRLTLALLGAQAIIRGDLAPQTANYTDVTLLNSYITLSALPDVQLRAKIAWWWSYSLTRNLRWGIAIGAAMWLKGAGHKLFFTRKAS